MANLLLTMLDMVGVRQDKLGDSTDTSAWRNSLSPCGRGRFACAKRLGKPGEG
jgi:hypothetical protein